MRRRDLMLATAAAAVAGTRGARGADTPAAPLRTHAVALVGTPDLPADFPHFPYANPDAPKGGEASLAALGGFDSFNPFILRGTAAPVGQIWDTLTVTSADEPNTGYAHLAAVIEVAADKQGVAFELRPEARWHDGKPITAADVVWTFETLRDKGRPNYRQYYADVASVAAEGERRVVFRFRNAGNRELPVILGQLAVLPRHWWEGRDFSAPLTEPPLGSSAFKVGRFEMGRTITLQRVPDWWGRDLPTARGLDNFDLRYEYFRDGGVALQAFKAGQLDIRRENVSKSWATEYDFPAARNGLVRRDEFEQRLPTGMQNLAMNTRRPVFADRRVREALCWAFDFEWTNRNLFYGLYRRTGSYFSGSDFASSGLPQGAELALLEPFRDKLPPEVFTTPFTLPVTDGSGNNREGLRRALALLKQAGWDVKERKLVDKDGRRFSFEVLLYDPVFERVLLPYAQTLERLGMEVRVRTVDPAQYQRLTDDFDFDMTVGLFPQSDSPGNEQFQFWSSAAANEKGSDNMMGVSDPVVDALIAKVIAAPDRDALITATRALDRVLLWGWYGVPGWRLGKAWVASWDRFARLDVPIRSGFALDAWWIDPAKDARIQAARRG